MNIIVSQSKTYCAFSWYPIGYDIETNSDIFKEVRSMPKYVIFETRYIK